MRAIPLTIRSCRARAQTIMPALRLLETRSVPRSPLTSRPRISIRFEWQSDAGGLATEQVLTIHVTDFNETPTAIALSNNSVVEKESIGAVVGNLITTDPDTDDQFTYALVSGEGSDNNASFAIDGGVLKTAEVFDFRSKSSYTVRIRSTDSGGLSTEQAFTIAISDVRIGGFDTALAVTYRENAAPIFIASVGTVADVQFLNFDGGTLTASLKRQRNSRRSTHGEKCGSR